MKPFEQELKIIAIIILAFFVQSIKTFSQEKAGPLPVYEETLDLNKIYQQGGITLLGEDDDIRVFSSSNHQTENSIAINPVNPNNIFISTNGRNVYNGGQYVTTHQTWFYTTDGGINWSGSEDNPNEILSGGDPVALFDYNGHAFYVTLGNPSGISVLKSTDGGATWGSTVNADPLNSTGDDKEHAVADISGTYPQNIYVAWTDFNATNDAVVLTRSTDGGSYFGNSRITIYSGSDMGQGTNIAIGPNGEVYVAFANYTNGNLPESGIRFTKSTDGGSSFSTANVAFTISGIRTSTYVVAAFNNTGVNSFPSMEVDRSNGSRRGWIYIVYADRNTGDADIYLRRSTNGGTNWSNAIRVNSDQVSNGKQQWFPSIDVDQVTGKIYVSYYNMDSTGYLTSRYVAVSENGGDTFVCRRISDVRFTPVALGSGYRDGYMGDYYETAVYNSRLYATWSDNREGNFQAYISPYGGVTVHQFLADGTTETGSVGNWNGSQFDDYPVPVTFDFSTGSSPVLRGAQSITSNQKYNEWDYDNDVNNHRSFLIVPGLTVLTSQFAPSYSGVTIKNVLEGTTINGGNVEFKDPWFIDYQDPSYGNQKRNRGMSAPFIPRSSPFYPNYSTSYSGNTYKGVFLDQDYNIPGNPYYSVQAISPQDINLGGSIGTRRFWFQKWDGTNVQFEDNDAVETGVVFTDEDAEAQAIFKGHLLSNETNGLSSNSQRKLVRDNSGKYHAVYTSLDRVWYTHSNTTNFDGSWTDDEALFEGYETTNPSIDVSGDDIAIVFEVTDGQDAVIYLWESPGQYTEVGTIDLNYYGNAYPVVSRTPRQIFIVYKPSATEPLKYRRYYYYGGQWNHYDANLPHSTSSSKNPTIYGYKLYDDVRIAWQEGNTKIKYLNLHWHNQIMDEADYREPSSGDGYTYNYSPSIISASDGARIVWVGKRSGGGGPSKVNNGQGIDVIGNEYRVVFKSPTYYRFWMFGSDVNSPNFNKSDNHTGYVFGWSEPSGGSYVNKFADQTLSTIKTIPDVHGRDIQISNGPGKSYMYSIILNTNQSPYDLEKSQSFGSIQKVNAGLVISSGREGVVYKGDSQFYFTIGDVMVNKKHINFVEIPDTLAIDSKEVLNDCLVTEPFRLNDNSNFTYGVLYGTTDSSATVSSLNDDDLINFKVELINASSGDLIGTFDNVTYTKENIFQYNNISYQVNTNGIGSRTVKLRLYVDDNLQANYSLSTKYAEDNLIPKSHKKEIRYQGLSAVESYDLAQNYPNPFNPSTTIKYQIPEDGMVTLKIYDILGREIKTLVNEQKSIGRYEVKFDASDLTTGVYIYRLKVNDFVSVKKMILVK